MASTPETIAWCVERNHPWSTYNPWLDRTWCRCGERQAAGFHEIDLKAAHEIFHTCAYDGSYSKCRCYVSESPR
jgi:hypothetical protein